MPRPTLTTEQFIEKAKAIHGEKYDYNQVNYTNKRGKLTIICKQHGEFKQIANDHLNGRGCQKCGLERIANAQRMTQSEFIEKSKVIHGDRYDYSKVSYTHSQDKVIIICKQHGEFKQTPNNHLYFSNGCPKCSFASMSLGTDGFVNKARATHGDKYDYSKVDYTNQKQSVMIICKHHGEFKQKAGNHLNGKGCPKCRNRWLNTNRFIEKSKAIHGNRYDYNKVDYKGICKKVVITCKHHGDFTQTASIHLRGSGCQKCGLIRSLNIVQSKPEIAFLDYLNVPKENRGYPIGKYLVDGIVNSTVYEFLGDYWHGHNRLEKGTNHIDIQIKRMLTQIRFEEIQKLTGFNIKYVWEADWNEYKKLGGHLKLRTFKDKLTID